MTRCVPVLLVFLFISLTTVACNKNSQPTVTVSPQGAPQPKRYHLKGKVVSVDAGAKMLNLDTEAIPGFMDAMTMPYQVKPESELGKLHPGDAITADIVVQDDNSWLENIVVSGHAAASNK